ncbi:uncharacterized protein ARMOST_12568 [Armillaria ostoyae]|uniref:Uncharacterized protein n=1 Tax=Armillaria ostoyae TaxID=47428 RepID=A0A284RKB4_ARMOS|nr:uncharacterized protein ARMOST_12568 [Armillaria ostoyae]
MSTFPLELVDMIVHEIWHSDMPSVIRRSFMTACPRINRLWKAIYSLIASQDIYITSLAYIYYLSDIAGRQKSVIYHDHIPRLTRAITCFVDCGENAGENVVKDVYRLLMWLPNSIGFKCLFPQVPYISLELSWIGGGRARADPQILHGLPIHIRYRRFLCEALKDGYQCVPIEINVSIADPDPLSSLYSEDSYWVFYELRNMGGSLSPLFCHGQTYHQRMCRAAILYYRQTTYISALRGDLEAINRHLWTASKRTYGLEWFPFANPLYYWEYKRLQRSLPYVDGMSWLKRHRSIIKI